MSNNSTNLEKKEKEKDVDPYVCLPYRYSRYGVYSSHLFLLNTCVNHAYGFKVLTGFGLSLYVTSVLHWRKIKHSGIYKWLDILTSISTVTYTTFVDSHYFITEHRNWWLIAKCFALSAYSINKYIEYYQQICDPSENKKENENENVKRCKESEKYRYFCLKHTKPDTEQRESAYFYSTLVHILGIHIPLVFTCINGVMHSHLKYNSFV